MLFTVEKDGNECCSSAICRSDNASRRSGVETFIFTGKVVTGGYTG